MYLLSSCMSSQAKRKPTAKEESPIYSLYSLVPFIRNLHILWDKASSQASGLSQSRMMQWVMKWQWDVQLHLEVPVSSMTWSWCWAGGCRWYGSSVHCNETRTEEMDLKSGSVQSLVKSGSDLDLTSSEPAIFWRLVSNKGFSFFWTPINFCAARNMISLCRLGVLGRPVTLQTWKFTRGLIPTSLWCLLWFQSEHGASNTSPSGVGQMGDTCCKGDIPCLWHGCNAVRASLPSELDL